MSSPKTPLQLGVRVYISAPEPLTAQGFRSILTQDKAINVVGESKGLLPGRKELARLGPEGKRHGEFPLQIVLLA